VNKMHPFKPVYIGKMNIVKGSRLPQPKSLL
jgi:hypothetical protein